MLQEVLFKIVKAKGMDPSIVINGVPPKNDSDQLSLGNDLKLTTQSDFGTLAKKISSTFNISFPWDEAQAAATLGDLVAAVFAKISASIGAAAARAMHFGPVTCPECGHVIGSKKKPSGEKLRTKSRMRRKQPAKGWR